MKKSIMLTFFFLIVFSSFVCAINTSPTITIDNLLGNKIVPECITEPPFINRLLKGCSIENNSVCEDGENLLIDDDCKPYMDDLKSGKIFTYMWFIRLMLLLSLVMFLRKYPNFPVIVLFIIILLAANGAFGNLSSSLTDSEDNRTMINETEAENIEKPNLLKEDFKDFGGLIMPNHPYLGGIALIVLFYIFIIFIPSRWGVRK